MRFIQSIEPIKTESWKRFQYAQNVQMTAQLNFESQRGQQSRNGDNSRKGHERTIMDSNGQKKFSSESDISVAQEDSGIT